MEFEAVEN